MIFPLRLKVSFIPFLYKERFDRHNLSATFSSDSDVKLDFAIVTSLKFYKKLHCRMPSE